jgi:uncharacterized protein YdeI (YjbR/CyaY-like superfamily)
MSGKKSTEQTLAFESARAFHDWLAKNHDHSDAVFLRLAKRGGAKSITYAEAIDVALAWGWIDSQKRALDDSAWLQRFSPRTPTSPWSKINCGKADALIATKKMQPSGLAEVERAKRDGRWELAYHGARTSEVPDDLARALSKNAGARAFFDALDGANRYAILFRVHAAKKPETRADRIARFVQMCAAHETLHPKRPAKTTKKSATPGVARRREKK